MPDVERPEWNPGGWAAKKKGCTCSRLANRDGDGNPTGLGDSVFVIELDCPLHADTSHPSLDDQWGQSGPATE